MKRIFNKILTFLLVFGVAFGLPVAAFQSSAASNTTVKVTVEVLWNSAATKVDSATYYVTAYSDSACTKVVDTKSVTLSSASSGSTTFNSLAAGTYYFAESNSSGTLKTDTSTLTISYPYGNIAYVSNDSGTKELKIQNNYSSDPNTASAKTADENQPLLFGGIAVLCVLVGGAVILMRRKHV